MRELHNSKYAIIKSGELKGKVVEIKYFDIKRDKYVVFILGENYNSERFQFDENDLDFDVDTAMIERLYG